MQRVQREGFAPYQKRPDRLGLTSAFQNRDNLFDMGYKYKPGIQDYIKDFKTVSPIVKNLAGRAGIDWIYNSGMSPAAQSTALESIPRSAIQNAWNAESARLANAPGVTTSPAGTTGTGSSAVGASFPWKGFLSGIASGYSLSGLTQKHIDSPGLGQFVGTAGATLLGGSAGGVGGFIGSAIYNIMNPGQRGPLADYKPRKKGELWQQMFSQLPDDVQRWITTAPDSLNDTEIENRIRTVAAIKNSVQDQYNRTLPEKMRNTNYISDKTIDKMVSDNINRFNYSSGYRDFTASSDLTMKPPIKSTDGWFYIDNINALPSLDRRIINTYSYDKYLEALGG